MTRKFRHWPMRGKRVQFFRTNRMRLSLELKRGPWVGSMQHNIHKEINT